MTLRDDAFMSIAKILSHYNKSGSRYNISHDMGVVLEYITHLESLLKLATTPKEVNHENN